MTSSCQIATNVHNASRPTGQSSSNVSPDLPRGLASALSQPTHWHGHQFQRLGRGCRPPAGAAPHLTQKRALVNPNFEACLSSPSRPGCCFPHCLDNICDMQRGEKEAILSFLFGVRAPALSPVPGL
ncbi:hypothetical protein VUR80DRAFT_878 [Thermomyces stellatus]